MEVEKIFAPVCIPTLSRYEHFKRCLESLERCTYADKTDVFVGLDYPPSEKYVNGWKKIDDYLAEKENHHGFKNLYVRRRDHNCGVGKLNSNSMLLYKEISKSNDRYIFSEDDNEFSPNFLAYCNWGLEYCKKDERIIAICSFNLLKTSLKTNNNVYIYNNAYCAWGSAFLIERKERLNSYYDFKKIKLLVDSYPLSIIFNRKVVLVGSLLYMLKKKVIQGDTILQVIPDDKKWCVFPTESKVRNWGLDGSGVHDGTDKSYQNQINLSIDMNSDFEPSIEEELFSPEITNAFNAEFKANYRDWLRSIVRFTFYKLTGRIVLFDKPKWMNK